ncbi:Acetyl-coenzyme A transferase nodX like protein [Verticillium longisporum]|nr:Acetyl-coenzyme A transferase nodX like protein [Verticillium longisporum]KAG7149832.1 Acetyl-coenzyme A transferase nodX like protein [Verticillium longisporum]
MTDCSVTEEAARVLNEVLLNDTRLGLPASFREAAKKVNFTSADPRPFVLTPAKFTESSSALTALAATAANVIASERYHIDYQDIEVNTDLATLFLGSVLLPMTKDGRWYHLHGSMNAKPTMAMLGIEESDVTADEEFRLYSEKVAQWDSQEIERVANNQYRQAGVVCLAPEEFHSSEQGKAMAEKPLWSVTPIPAPRKAWPRPEGSKDLKPLAGIKVLDLSRVIAAPAVSKILAVLGAEVLRVSCDALPEYAATMVDLQTGKRDTNLNLKTDEGRDKLRELVKDADLLVDGFRPTALAKLGFSTEVLRALNPSLIYMRENCYGFDGPLAGRSGWQQISDCLVGLAHVQGKFLGLDEPVVPLLHWACWCCCCNASTAC